MKPRFKSSASEAPQAFRVPRVRFLGEQDGPYEQLLKQRLVERLKTDPSVSAAYLARADLGKETSVVLCLVTQHGPIKGLVEEIGAIFKTLFGRQAHLDIMFPTASQHVTLAGVCPPFYCGSRGDGA
jgi:hypothetical protein